MKPRLLKLTQDVSASYWFVPMCMVVLSILLAAASAWIDLVLMPSGSNNAMWISSLGADDARAILTLISGSVIGVAGVSFSITIVAVSFATSNFGPRLISNFMTDRGNQISLGCFIGVFVFCLVTLTTLNSPSSDPDHTNAEVFVPHIGVAISLVMAVLSMGVLIYFIHHVADSINIEEILANIGRRLEHKVIDLFPDNTVLDEQLLAQGFNETSSHRLRQQICAVQSGYVQTLDLQKMLDYAIEHQLLIDVHVRPGDYVSHQTLLLSVWLEKEKSESDLNELQACFATGDQRTEHQNVLFLIEQLTEVIVRALSSGINDPYTAITCLNWLRNALVIYLQNVDEHHNNQPSTHHRIRISPVTFEQILEVVFDACEQHVAGDEKVTLHAMAVLVECTSHSNSEQTREQLLSRYESLYARSSERLDSQAKNSIRQRYFEGIAVISGTISHSDARDQYRWFTGSG